MLNRKCIFSIVIIFLVLEAGLRLSGKLKTYTELISGIYRSPYSSENMNHFFVLNPDDSFTENETEFSYEYTTNSFGLISKP